MKICTLKKIKIDVLFNADVGYQKGFIELSLTLQRVGIFFLKFIFCVLFSNIKYFMTGRKFCDLNKVTDLLMLLKLFYMKCCYRQRDSSTCIKLILNFAIDVRVIIMFLYVI